MTLPRYHAQLIQALAPAVLLTLVLGWSGAACAQTARMAPQTGLRQGTVTAKGVVFTVDLAESRAQQAHGLGGRAHLGPADGMLFPYAEKDTYTFWMRGMVIAIDIIWLDNREVVHIAHNVPPPAPGAPDYALQTYTPLKPANFVLEIAAGRAREIGLRVGDLVRYTLP